MVDASAAAPEAGAPIQKPIPKSGEMLPVIGIGTNRYGVGTSDEARAPLRETMARFAELAADALDIVVDARVVQERQLAPDFL